MLPGGITTIVVTGTYLTPAGDPVLVREGRPAEVTFTPSSVITDGTGKVIFTTRPVVALLNAEGQFTVTLACTDNASLNPPGWCWNVNEVIPDLGRSYSVLLPSTLGATVDISDLSPVAEVTPVSSYVLSSQVGAPSGVAELDSTGHVPDGEIPDLSGQYLSLAGGTMTGFPVLPGNPTASLQAATKAYVDASSGDLTAGTGLTLSGATISLDTPVSVADGGTGAVSASLALQALGGQPVFSVKAYGAHCDGVTDDTTYVEAAYAAAAGGGTVLFPAGTVTCVQGNINPAGAATWGPGATIRFLAGITPSNSMFVPSAACSFYGLTFDLNKSGTTNPGSLIDGAAVYAYNASGWAGQVRLTGCTVINGWQCGLIFGTASVTSPLSLPSSPFLVDGCTVTGCGQIGVYAFDTADGVVTNSYIHSNGASGIEEVTGLRNRFSGNTCVSNATHGIVSEYSYGTVIIGNDCTDNGVSGIVIGGGSTTISPASHFTITGNTCRNNGHTAPGHGIDVDTTVSGESSTAQPAYGTITGNACDANTDHGIYINNAQYVAVTGNTSTGNGLYGVQLTTVNASVSSNIATGNTYGIVIDSGGGHVIGANYTAGNTSGGYYDAGTITSTYTVPAVNASPSTAPGAQFNGSADDSAALNAAQAANQTLFLPNGTAPVGTTVTLSKSGLTIRGAGMYSTTIQATAAIGILQYSSGYVTEVEISDLTLDGNSEATSGLISYGSRIGRLTVRRCRFINFPGIIIEAGYAANYVIEDCVAEGGGQAAASFFYAATAPFESLILRRNKLRYMYQGIVVGATGYHAGYVEITDNDIDGGWYLLTAEYSGSGSSVTYTATGLTDTSASFGSIPATSPSSRYVRALSPRQSSSFTTISGTYFTDTSAAYVTNGVKRGEIIRSGTVFAVVASVISNTALHVEEWLSQTTYLPAAPPAASAAYVLYAVYLGCVTANTATTITVEQGAGGGGGGWFDLAGAAVTPAAGTLYEVLSAAGGYPVFCTQVTEKLIVSRNRVRRGRYDNLELFGSQMIVTDNIAEDGQDEGIVIQGLSTSVPCELSVISGNLCSHNGSSGLFVADCANIEIGPNQYYNNSWTGPAANNFGQLSLYQATNVTVTGGRATNTGESSPSAGLNIYGAATSGIVVCGFTGIGHSLGDIYITSSVPAASCDLLDVTGVITYQSGASGQRLRVKGTGTPAILASTGSQYTQTDATASPGWMYQDGQWVQGIGSTVPGDLTAGGTVTAYGGFASAALTVPTGLTVTPAGTAGSTVYGYCIQAVAGASATAPCAETEITNGNAALSGTNYNQLSWTAVVGALAYNVCGRTHNGESLLAQVTGTTYADTGTATPAAARNLLTLTAVTPSFTAGALTGWNTQIGATYSNDATTGPNANGCSMKIITSGSAGSGAASNNTIGPACTPGDAYTLSFYAKGSGTLRALFNSNPAFAAFASNVSISLTSAWTRYTVTGTVPSGQSTVYAVFECNTAVTFWISAVQIEQASSASAYIDTTPAVAMPATGAQMIAQAWPSQTADPLAVENSSGTTVFSVDPSGNATVAGTLTVTGAGGVMSNPMSAAGDLIDGAVGGTPQVLHIGTTGQVLTVSAGAPAWAALPAATTAAAGIVGLDGTAGDIQPSPGTAAAGSSGLAADAKHVHPQPAALAPSGLTGATAASRYAGATTSGAPATGTFAAGDFVIDQTGPIWVYTGSTWVAAGGATPVGKQAAYSSITANITPAVTSAYSALTGAPSITLPNDGHTYSIRFFAPSVEISVAGNVYIAIGTGTTGILNSTLQDIAASSRLYSICVEAQSVTGSGQAVTVYALNSAGSSTLTVFAGAGGASSAGPCELAAYRVA